MIVRMIIHALILGIVQGITEFLPVSSTAHLVLVERLLGVLPETFGLAFDASLHLGTALAVIFYFRNKLLGLFRGLRNKEERKLLTLLVVGTIPAVAVGLVFEDVVEIYLRNPQVIAVMLIGFSVIFWVIEKQASKKKTLEHINVSNAVFVGIAQAIALIPGVSRSGNTMSAGLLVGLDYSSASEFAFLLSIPIVAGAGGQQLVKIIFSGSSISWGLLFVGIMTSTLVGFLTISFFLKIIKRVGLYPFIIYRIALGVIILLWKN